MKDWQMSILLILLGGMVGGYRVQEKLKANRGDVK
jgi:hypothetical protein